MTHHIAIIGAGASGTLLAANLDRLTAGRIRISLIEQADRIARGIAYAPVDRGHLLNTRVRNMSAYADAPDHFGEWLATRPGDATPACFVTRAIYGDYLEAQLRPGLERGSIRLHAASCTAIETLARSVALTLDDGSTVMAHAAVLATGHPSGASAGSALSNPWHALPDIAPDAPVIFIGSGLTMVDWALSLLDRGHTGPMTALSRHGLLPQAHSSAHPLRLSAADIPLGTSTQFLTRWLRKLAAEHQARGGDWREVLDGIRPHIRTLWHHLTAENRKIFLRHLASFWEVHRHRMPPQSAARIAQALASGQLKVVKGRYLSARRAADGTVEVSYQPRSGVVREPQILTAAAALDCRGIRRSPETPSTPLLQDILENGTGRIDPLGLGLDFDSESRLLTASGQPHPRLFGIGPVTRAAFWEITAIPEIREQAALLARRLSQPLASGQTATAPARGKLLLPPV